ncbi:MAG: Flp pilus assembly protein CpaB [Acidobacteriota bacterium]
MPRRTAIIIAVVVSLLSLILILIILSASKGIERGPVTHVVIAKKDILAKTIIEFDMVEIRNIPQAFKQPSALVDPKDAIGKVALVPIVKDSQILATNIDTLEKAGLDFTVKTGMRAVTISVDEIRSVAGQINPGSKVDIFGTFEYAEGEKSPALGVFTKLLLADVEIIAVETKKGRLTLEDLLTEEQIQRMQAEGKTSAIGGMKAEITQEKYPSNVTLLTKIEDAQMLIEAQTIGRITLILRNPSDKLPMPPLEEFHASKILGTKKYVRSPAAMWEEIRAGRTAFER